VGGRTQWPTAAGSASGPEATPDSAALERLIFARFEILEFTTEGVNPPIVRRWVLHVRRADSAATARASYWRTRGRLVAVAEREDTGARSGATRAQAPDPEMAERYEVRLQPATGVLHWYSLFGGNEGGASYSVAEIDSTGFHGRWEDGGIGLAFVQRGDVRTLERLRGFYCARQIR
jgi:hypothetical protein